MSLSHLAGLEQHLLRFHLTFTPSILAHRRQLSKPPPETSAKASTLRNFFPLFAFNKVMMKTLKRSLLGLAILAAVIGCMPAPAQPPANPAAGPVLDWTPPALAQLSAQAATRSSFTLDRTMLSAAAALMPDSDDETKQAINKIDGVNVHLLRFGAAGIANEAPVDAIRQAYHLRGWKHLVTTDTANKGPLQNGTTDVWLVLDGVNVRGAVVLAETPKSLTLVTVAGNLSPVDLLHLRGHFGIPKFDGSDFKDAKDK